MIKKVFCLFFFIAVNVYSANQGIEFMKTDISNIELLISHKDIKSKIIEMAQVIDRDYKDEGIVILMIMKGSFIFTADLIRELKTPFCLEAITCSSYGQKGKQRGELMIRGWEKIDLKSKNVLIIDDVYDSGNTMTTVIKEISKQNPKSIKSMVALVKKSPRVQDFIFPNYYLFEIENEFVVGYGLDYKEYFRGLKGLYIIK